MHEKKITTDTKVTPRRTRRVVFMLAAFATLQIAGYGYMVNASVSHVVHRMSLEKETGEIVSSVSKLESTYFGLQNGVTADTATNEGYTTGGSLQYVDAHGLPVTMLSRSN